MKSCKHCLIFCLLFSSALYSLLGATSSDIEEIVTQISQDNVREILMKLESFQTRHVLSSDKDNFGINASAEWIHEKFTSLSPRLQVSFDSYELEPQGRMRNEFTLRNVVAVLPGKQTGENERIFLLNAHYDTVARTEDGSFPRDSFDNFAPGVNDDGSGLAALIEIARVFSRHEFDATVYFVAFSGEEVGLVGSTLMAARLKKEDKNIEGVLTLDMIGNIQGGNGILDNKRIRVFSAGPADSPSRQLARYAKRAGEHYFPSAHIDCIYRADRFGRGGDHTPFVLEGWPGIRIMEANENYSRQHTVHDTLENLSLEYCTRNIRIIGSILASLASAPPPPRVTSERGRPQLGRGDNGYSAQLKWDPVPYPDLAGYKILWRSTTAPFWEKEIYVGDRTEYTLENITIDEYIFGVRAVDRDGSESLVSAYTMAPRSKRTYKIKE
jgi:hypothetical protein